jgi:hypothetical protein
MLIWQALGTGTYGSPIDCINVSNYIRKEDNFDDAFLLF